MSRPEPKITDNIMYLKGVGPRRAELFNGMGIFTVEDLLLSYVPRRYVDRSTLQRIIDLEDGEEATICGAVHSFAKKQTSRGEMFTVMITDESAFLACNFFNAKYIYNQFEIGDEVLVSGKVNEFRGALSMIHPECEVISGKEEALHAGRIVPIYPLVAGLYQKHVRKIMKYAVDHYLAHVEESIPTYVLKAANLMSLKAAVKHIHYPDSMALQEQAHDRLAFEELFYLELMLALQKREFSLSTKDCRAIQFPEGGTLSRKLVDSLPFELTRAQKRAIREIVADMRSENAMNRLLQGDVGAGKTIVAVLVMLIAVENGYQAAIMAPTEILAEQHFRKISAMVASYDLGVKVVRLIGGLTKTERDLTYSEIATGAADIVVGTHALIQESLEFHNLGFVVIDEQHRFGVIQRAALREKSVLYRITPETLQQLARLRIEPAVLDQLSTLKGQTFTDEADLTQTLIALAGKPVAAELSSWIFARLKKVKQVILTESGLAVLQQEDALPEDVKLTLAALINKPMSKRNFTDYLKIVIGAKEAKTYKPLIDKQLERRDAYQFTVDTLSDLEARSIPPEVIHSLKTLCQTEPILKSELIQRLKTLLGEEAAYRYRSFILAHAERVRQNPDMLVMTATPIPRTLAMTVYGNLDVSIIDEVPPGRQAIQTSWVTNQQREKLYDFVRQQLQEGRQAYFVYPLVEESEKMDLKAATEMADAIRKQPQFKPFRVALLHGRMIAEEKDEIMELFLAKHYHILVSTTVIEVGVDVPNASVMVIENAERFGLTQMHQLRGRVGRGNYQSYCILVASHPVSETARQRLEIMTSTTDGFKIAEADLKIRGPGEFFGTRQSGLPEMNVADLVEDAGVLFLARELAFKVVATDPELAHPANHVLRHTLERKYRKRFELARAV